MHERIPIDQIEKWDIENKKKYCVFYIDPDFEAELTPLNEKYNVKYDCKNKHALAVVTLTRKNESNLPKP